MLRILRLDPISQKLSILATAALALLENRSEILIGRYCVAYIEAYKQMHGNEIIDIDIHRAVAMYFLQNLRNQHGLLSHHLIMKAFREHLQAQNTGDVETPPASDIDDDGFEELNDQRVNHK